MKLNSNIIIEYNLRNILLNYIKFIMYRKIDKKVS